jgi:hypothetical protein
MRASRGFGFERPELRNWVYNFQRPDRRTGIALAIPVVLYAPLGARQYKTTMRGQSLYQRRQRAAFAVRG